MNIDFTGRQMEIGDDLRQYTQGRLRKITRLLGDTYEMHVILTAEKHRRLAEVTLKFRDHTLVGVEESGDPRISLNRALDKLERQAVRLLERRRTRKRRPKPTTTVVLNVLGPEHVEREERPTLEAERVPIKPMSVEEAITALDQSRAGVVVFRNPETERVNVIYHRPDGNLGLIEPEP
jgi:putative sigma-54 modulation protein